MQRERAAKMSLDKTVHEIKGDALREMFGKK